MAGMNAARERAVNACQAVSDRVERSREHVATLVGEAHGLSTALGDAQSQLKARSSELVAAIHQGDARLMGHVGGALAGLTQLQSRGQDLSDQVQAMLSHVEKGIEELERLQHDMLQQVESQASRERSTLVALVSKIEALQGTVDDRLDEASRRIERFHDDLLTARDEIASTRERVDFELTTLEARLKGAIEELVGGADALITAGDSAFERLDRDLDRLADEAVDLMSARIAEDVVSELERTVQPLEHAFRSLEELMANGELSLRGSLGDIAEHARQIEAGTAKVKPVLETIERLLSARDGGDV